MSVGDDDVAYQVLGEGPPDLLLFNGLGSHVEMNWQVPDYRDLFTRLASFSRLIMFDRRGTGASGPGPQHATWEEFTEEARAVLDAVGSQHAAVIGIADTGPMALLFAAIQPERVTALVLVSCYAGYVDAGEFRGALPPELREISYELYRSIWGTTEIVRMANPSRAEDEAFLELGAAINRASATPRRYAELIDQLTSIDVRPLLPLIQAPTLVLQSRDNEMIALEMGHYLAAHIEGAKFIELPGGDFGLIGDSAGGVEEVAEFLTGQRSVEVDRILATVLFTDIASSTTTAASLGDRRWRSLLDSHDEAVRGELKRFRGREVNTTGDGFVISFDGPARAIRCAESILETTRPLGLDLRVGIHTGECELRGDDLAGLAVHIAARVGALAVPGEVLVSGTVKELVVGSGIEFDDRGEHDLKGVPGIWKLFAVSN